MHQSLVVQQWQSPQQESKGTEQSYGHYLGKSLSTVLTLHQQLKQELNQYLSHRCWRILSQLVEDWSSAIPYSSKTSTKIFMLCATSVAAEHVFSCGGNNVSDRRTSLKPEWVDSLVFLAKSDIKYSWLWLVYYHIWYW